MARVRPRRGQDTANASTEDAPWHVVPAENKKYARLMVLRIYRDALKRALR